jgi:hypothetical protein
MMTKKQQNLMWVITSVPEGYDDNALSAAIHARIARKL